MADLKDPAPVRLPKANPWGGTEGANTWEAGNMAKVLLERADYKDAVKHFAGEFKRDPAGTRPYTAAVYQAMAAKSPAQALQFIKQMADGGLARLAEEAPPEESGDETDPPEAPAPDPTPPKPEPGPDAPEEQPEDKPDDKPEDDNEEQEASAEEDKKRCNQLHANVRNAELQIQSYENAIADARRQIEQAEAGLQGIAAELAGAGIAAATDCLKGGSPLGCLKGLIQGAPGTIPVVINAKGRIREIEDQIHGATFNLDVPVRYR